MAINAKQLKKYKASDSCVAIIVTVCTNLKSGMLAYVTVDEAIDLVVKKQATPHDGTSIDWESYKTICKALGKKDFMPKEDKEVVKNKEEEKKAIEKLTITKPVESKEEVKEEKKEDDGIDEKLKQAYIDDKWPEARNRLSNAYKNNAWLAKKYG